MYLTESGISMLAKDVQLLNVKSPMLLTEFGILMRIKDVQLKNSLYPIHLTLLMSSRFPSLSNR
jgi:hypothetical protein